MLALRAIHKWYSTSYLYHIMKLDFRSDNGSIRYQSSNQIIDLHHLQKKYHVFYPRDFFACLTTNSATRFFQCI